MADHDRERVVELVGDAGEQRAERAHLLVLVQDLALPLELGLDPLGLGQVDDRGDHGVPALEGDQLGGEGAPELGAVGAAQVDLVAVEEALASDQLDQARPIGRIGVDRRGRAGEQLGQRRPQQLRAGRAREDHPAGCRDRR